MLDQETRSAILTLHEKGRSQRDIAEALHISRASVQMVLKTKRRLWAFVCLRVAFFTGYS